MKAEAIQGNDSRRSIFIPIGQGAVLGAATGYIAKYAYPLTADEKSTDEYVKVSKKINQQKTEYNFRTDKYIKSIKNKEQKSLAEEEFVKMFDGLKEGDHVKLSKIRKAIKTIQEKNPNELLEFKRVCKASSEVVEKTAKQFMNAYDLVTKHIRPTNFFLATGAVVGAFIALINDVIKTDIKK